MPPHFGWRLLGAGALAIIASQLLSFVLHGPAYFAASFLCGVVAYYVARYA